jgi:hypothetical protein
MKVILLCVILLVVRSIAEASPHPISETMTTAKCESLSKKRASGKTLTLREMREFLDWCIDSPAMLIGGVDGVASHADTRPTTANNRLAAGYE